VVDFHRRRLPHFHAIGQPIFLTWRLYGSLPRNRWFDPALTDGEAFVAMDRILEGFPSGPLYLALPDIAQIVVEAVEYRHRRQYDLHSFVVMPNHLHLLITPLIEVHRLTQSLKRHTARQANLVLGLTGRTFWQDESYDRLVRNREEFQRVVHYIENNPVRAGLAPHPDAFPWSSAGRCGAG
jgi:REP element-mobilizing transposase RayT